MDSSRGGRVLRKMQQCWGSGRQQERRKATYEVDRLRMDATGASPQVPTGRCGCHLPGVGADSAAFMRTRAHTQGRRTLCARCCLASSLVMRASRRRSSSPAFGAVLFPLAVLLGVRWCLIMVSICCSLRLLMSSTFHVFIGHTYVCEESVQTIFSYY